MIFDRPRSRNARSFANDREERTESNERIRVNMTQLRAGRRRNTFDLNRAAFQYDSTIAYKYLPCLDIGPLDVLCVHCQL